jgi:hypothetical protein
MLTFYTHHTSPYHVRDEQLARRKIREGKGREAYIFGEDLLVEGLAGQADDRRVKEVGRDEARCCEEGEGAKQHGRRAEMDVDSESSGLSDARRKNKNGS